MEKQLIVNSEVAHIYAKNSFNSQLITQALLWEPLSIIDRKELWFQVKQNDGYIGWIHQFYIITSEICKKNNLDNCTWFFIKERIVKVVNSSNSIVKYLSFGTMIPIISRKSDDLSIVLMPDGSNFDIKKDHLIPCNNNLDFNDIKKISLNLLGTPYLWGGKTGYGFDCSGLIQSIFRLINILLPRDSKDQIKFKNLKVVSKNFICGDLIFFSKNNIIMHVGMFINSTNFIHSSGYVKINSISKTDECFDQSLHEMIYNIYRIKSKK